MDTVTREVVRQERTSRREAEEAWRLQEQAAAQTSWQLDWDKARAIETVEAAARDAVERLSIDPSKWADQGIVERVCKWTGPHHGFWCFFHGRKRVTLLKIPGVHGGCASCSRSHSRSSFGVHKHLSMHLGSDGSLYRYGHTKIFKAKLMDRHHAKHIRALVHKLNAME